MQETKEPESVVTLRGSSLSLSLWGVEKSKQKKSLREIAHRNSWANMQPARFGSHLAACILSRARSVGSVVAQRVQALGVHGSAGESSTSGPTDLATKGPYVARLKSRGVIRFDGPDVVHYLQGLLTNDVTKFESKTQQESAAPSPNTSAAFYPPVYSAVLSPQGRVLFDLFLYKPSAPIEKLNRSGSGPGDGNDNTPALLADVDAAALDDLLAFLKKYVSLSLSLSASVSVSPLF